MGARARLAVAGRFARLRPHSRVTAAPGARQALTDKGLRERVLLRVDGGMRSGRDVLVTAALGGDEYGFGTVAMIATGCIMARVCHTNNCPVGVASQREELHALPRRARRPGVPRRPGAGPCAGLLIGQHVRVAVQQSMVRGGRLRMLGARLPWPTAAGAEFDWQAAWLTCARC